MKKIISVLLAVLMLTGLFAVLALAEDGGYTQVYTVNVAETCADKVVVIPKNGTNYVQAGEDFEFRIEPIGNFRLDSTVVVKAFPATVSWDIFTSADMGEGYGEELIPRVDGYYTVKNIREDTVIAVYNVTKASTSNAKQLLYNLFHFLLDIFKRLFGLY